MQKAVQAQVGVAARMRERVGAGQRRRTLQFVTYVEAVGLVLLVRGGCAQVFHHQRGDVGHRWRIGLLVHHTHQFRQRAAHDQPHDDFGAFHAALGGVVGNAHVHQRLWVCLQQVQEFGVPGFVEETCTFPVHLVRQAAGGHHGHVQVLGVALDGLAQRLAQLPHAPGAGYRQLQHAHLQRHHLARPRALRVSQHGQRRQEAMVHRLALEERHVELVSHQRHGDVLRQAQVTLRRWHVARSAAFVGRGVAVVDAQRERRVVVEEERRDVVVVDREQHVHVLLAHPAADGVEAVKDGLPRRVLVLAGVLGKANRG